MNKLLIALSVALASLSVSAGPLQDLVNAAAPNSVVTVPAGIYNEPVTLKEGMILVSEAGPEATVIDGGGVPYVVVGGKQSAIIGFTIHNGQNAVYNMGNFMGVFECIISNFAANGINLEKGSAAVANNLVTGSTNGTGIACNESNPYVGYNVVSYNKTGFSVARGLIPTLDHNVFLSNEVAVASVDGTAIVFNGNVYDGNKQNVTGIPMGTNDEVRAATAAELKLLRGQSVESYRALMKKVFEEAAAMQPRIIYDLSNDQGKFNLIVTYPYATFSVSASARDTVIRAYDAYDHQTDAALNAQYVVAHGGHPTVAVINPQLIEKGYDRYVLEKIFEHIPSYTFNADGTRSFNRLTNLSRIEVVLPAGWTLAQGNPGATVEQRGARQVVKLLSMGMTTLSLSLTQSAAAAQ